MTIYYSKANQAFYDSNIHSRLPEDAVAISPEQHAALNRFARNFAPFCRLFCT